MKTIKFLICIILISNDLILVAQTGPGGVGNATNNIIWLDANFGVYSDGGTTLAINTNNVQQWNDKSGNNNQAIQGIVENRPNYFTNIINGNPIVRFSSANNDRLISLGLNNTNNASVWFVPLYTSLPSPNPGLIQATAAGNSGTINLSLKTIGIWVGNDNNVWGRGVQSDNTIRDINKSITLAANNYYIISTLYRTNQIDQYVNNQISGSNTAHNGTLNSWTDASIGRQGTESWNGDIAEMFIFNIEVNSAQRIIIDNYLAAKYGLSLAANNIYDEGNPANGNYDFEVAGIGRVDASNFHTDAQGSSIVRILNPTGLNDNEFLIWGHDNGVQEAIETIDVPGIVQARFDRVWRVSEVNTSSTAVDVGSIDIRFDLSGLGSVTDSNLCLLVDRDNDGFFNDEIPISGATWLGSNIYEFSGVTAIENNLRFTLGTINSNQTPLPIQLVFFNAIVENERTVKLEWVTASETNNDFFTIERSLNAFDWEIVTTINGAANSGKPLTYSTLDYNPYNNVSYYRLKQTDFAGRFEYSNIKSVNLKETVSNNVYIYPNPTNNFITIKGHVEELAEIKIINTLGQEMTHLISITNENASAIIIDLSNLSQGVYYVKTKTTANSVYKK